MRELETQEHTELISVREAARIANVSYQTIWRLVQRGDVEALRVGIAYGPLRIDRAAFLRWLHGDPKEAA